MTIAAVVALYAEAEGLSGEGSAIEADFAGESGVGMGRLAKADPAFIAENRAEIGMVAEFPGNGVAAHVEMAPAAARFNAAVGDAEREREPAARTKRESFQGETFDKSLWFALSWEPRGPNLNG